MLSKKKRVLIVSITFFILSVVLAMYYFLFTSKGSVVIANKVLSKYAALSDINIDKVKGSVGQSVTYEDMVIRNLNFLPRDNTLKIGKIDISVSDFNTASLNVKVHNATLKIPGFDTIFFYGTFQDKIFDIHIYSKNFTLGAVLALFKPRGDLRKISGHVSDFDVAIKGKLSNPVLTGSFDIKDLVFKDVSLVNCPVKFDLKTEDIFDNFKMSGNLLLAEGAISASRTAMVALAESKINFDGDFKNPSFNIKGASYVDGTKIDIVFKGTFAKPDLKLTSQPPFGQDHLLIMLATNRSWKGAEGLLNQKPISADLAKDFLDYFLFSGSGSKLAQRLGVSDLSVSFDKNIKGLGVKKTVTDKFGASYEIQQSQIKDKNGTLTQKVGGEYKVTDSISVGAEKEIKQESKNQEPKDKQEADNKVMLKFKKEF
ncbi:MAG: translocation/assembly module TamB domain-containing protein [Candidatus Omnitrophota bacterium]